jgi:hypothetical protein
MPLTPALSHVRRRMLAKCWFARTREREDGL